MNYTPLTPEFILDRLLEISLYTCVCCRASDRAHLEARLRFEIEVGVSPDPEGCREAMAAFRPWG